MWDHWRARRPAPPAYPGAAFFPGTWHLAPFCAHLETSAKIHIVILSAAKDLVFSRTYEILRSLRSLRMTGEGTFAEVLHWFPSSYA